jgi:hypothetical protein
MKEIKKNSVKLAGYNGDKREPSRRERVWLNKQLNKIIFSDKWKTDTDCAIYDNYIIEKNLNLNQIKNPYGSNRLCEVEAALFAKLHFGGVGGGPDTVENVELKAADYAGLNKITKKLNCIQFYFNGIGKYKTLKEQMEHAKIYFSYIEGLAFAIRCPNGHSIHFLGEMNKQTKNILMESASKRYLALTPTSKDPRMRVVITSNDLLEISNFKLIKGQDIEFVKKYLGNSYRDCL